MLKQAAILLAAIAITACEENAAVSSASVDAAADTAPTTATMAEEKKAAALIKATKAAIIIESYEVEANEIMPAKTSSAGGQDR